MQLIFVAKIFAVDIYKLVSEIWNISIILDHGNRICTMLNMYNIAKDKKKCQNISILAWQTDPHPWDCGTVWLVVGVTLYLWSWHFYSGPCLCQGKIVTCTWLLHVSCKQYEHVYHTMGCSDHFIHANHQDSCKHKHFFGAWQRRLISEMIWEEIQDIIDIILMIIWLACEHLFTPINCLY